MTEDDQAYAAEHLLPQWSQPRMGWMTSASMMPNVSPLAPQWSQPRMGWMTGRLVASHRAGRAAAMEPAQDGLDDSSRSLSRLPAQTECFARGLFCCG